MVSATLCLANGCYDFTIMTTTVMASAATTAMAATRVVDAFGVVLVNGTARSPTGSPPASA